MNLINNDFQKEMELKYGKYNVPQMQLVIDRILEGIEVYRKYLENKIDEQA